MSWTSNPNPQTARKFALTVHAYLRCYNEVTYTCPSPHKYGFSGLQSELEDETRSQPARALSVVDVRQRASTCVEQTAQLFDLVQ